MIDMIRAMPASLPFLSGFHGTCGAQRQTAMPPGRSISIIAAGLSLIF